MPGNILDFHFDGNVSDRNSKYEMAVTFTT